MRKLSKNFAITLGSDPELALFDVKQNKIVSSIPVLKTDKYDPIKLGRGMKMYADNVLVEFSFNPSKTSRGLISSFKRVFQSAQDKLGHNYRIIPKAAHNFSKKELIPQFGIDPQQIGCNPSFDAWTQSVNDPEPFKDGLRTGSAHFHVGNEKLKDFNTRIKAIKLLDIFVGLSSVIFDKDLTSKKRRFLYGKSSEHRPTPYGLEYRCLGPYSIISPKITQLVLDLIEYSMTFIEDDTADNVIKLVIPAEVQKAINNCDKGLALKILEQVGLPKEFMKRIHLNYSQDFYKNWGIKVK